MKGVVKSKTRGGTDRTSGIRYLAMSPPRPSRPGPDTRTDTPTEAFTEEHRAGLWRMFDLEFDAPLRELGLLEGATIERTLREPETLGGDAGNPGRAPTAIVPVPGRRERLHVRRVLHGGVLAPLWRKGLAGYGRMRGELLTTALLKERGAPVPRPVFAAAWRHGPLWRGAFATLYEEGMQDALAFLEDLVSEASRQQLEATAHSAARALRLFHDAGGHHPDLHIKNLLVDRAGSRRPGRERAELSLHPHAAVIDLDGARCGTPPSPRQRQRELARLARSLQKRRPPNGEEFFALLEAAYHNGDAPS